MIGHSLSFCVMQLLDGKVQEKDVQIILCGFHFEGTYRQFRNLVVRRYLRVYWRKKKRRAIRIARRLFKRGKL